jgi:hypothetical protein
MRGYLLPSDHRYVCRFTRFEATDLRAERRGPGSILRRHAENIGVRWHGMLHAWFTVQVQRQSYFLEHVPVIVDTRFIDTDRNADATLSEPGVSGAIPLRSRRLELGQ